MSDSLVSIRRLAPNDAAALRALRLESLQAYPAAFASAYEEDAARSVEDFAAMLEGGDELVVFGAFRGEALVGMAGFAREAKQKMRHKGMLWGVYVKPACHGRRLGERLVQAVIEHARGRVLLLHACVSTTNPSARKVYFGLGFKSWGVEERALLVDGQWQADDHIVLEL